MTPAQPPPSLLTERLEAPLAPLDRLPRGLWLGTLTHSHGELVSRLQGVEGLRAALLAGRGPSWRGDTRPAEPPARGPRAPPGPPLAPGQAHPPAPALASPGSPWPSPALARAVAAAFATLELPRHCRGDEGVTDLVLRSLLWHLDQVPDLVDRGRTPAAAEAEAVEAFAADWSERCAELAELVEVLGALGDLARDARWDLVRGLLRSAGWQEVVRIRALLERLPELVRLVRQLGRSRPTDLPDEARTVTVHALEAATEVRAVPRTRPVPDLPGETRGVRRSGRVARMLASEAALLDHPRLRLVWHARHAERSLLTYEDDDRLTEVVPQVVPVLRETARTVPAPRLEMGPMLVCVDTSGSMQGGAEQVAKAVVLEAVRTAHAQRRPCHVFAFSGPGEVVDMALAVDPGGLERLTRFMGQGFGGGTDVGAPLERALAILDEQGWQLADLLVASDGEFGATPEVLAALQRARHERGLRVQGVLIGDRETIGMRKLADDVFWVRDWRRYGGSRSDLAAEPRSVSGARWRGDVGSPIESKSLTAELFPGAVRGPAKPGREDP